MFNRSELECHHTFDEIHKIIEELDDHDEHSTAHVRQRRGILKTIIEEYHPLFHLARILTNFKSARLMPNSHPGPDAEIILRDESLLTVQITCSGESTNTRLQRDLLNNGNAVYPNQFHESHRGEIVYSGRILTTKNAMTQRTIDEVLSSIKLKNENYWEGTQLLLISIRQSEIGMTDDWRDQVCKQVEYSGVSPYQRIYVSTNSDCFQCA